MYKSWCSGVFGKGKKKRPLQAGGRAAMSFERIKGSQEEKVMGGWLCMDGRPFSAISEDK